MKNGVTENLSQPVADFFTKNFGHIPVQEKKKYASGYKIKGRKTPLERAMLGKVYFFVCAELYVKIGWSTDVLGRLQKVRSTNPFPLRVAHITAGQKAEESNFHSRFAAYRHHLEWFRYEGKLKEFLEGAVNAD